MFMFPKTLQFPKNTSEKINYKIRRETEARIKYYSLRDKNELNERIKELDDEWDVENVLEVNAGSLAMGGALLGILLDKRFFLLSAVATGFLIQHSIKGWCPPIPLIRKFGIRTRHEIDIERNALKAIRGDYRDVSEEKDNLTKAEKAFEAAE